MNISHQKVDAVNANVLVELVPEDYNPAVDKAIKEQAKKAKLPGFRPGMVPTGHIRRMYGKSILLDEISRLVNGKISEYLVENKLEMLGQPLPADDGADSRYAWDFTDNFAFTYEIGLAPEFEIPFSNEAEFTEYDIKADETTLADRIKNLRRSYGKMSNPEVSEDGDVLYVLLKQDKAEGIEKMAPLRTDVVRDAEIKQTLIGLKEGDTVRIDLKKAFETYDLARTLDISEEEAENLDTPGFELTVKRVNRLEESDLDQAFFDKLFPAGEVATEEEFRARVKAEVEGMFRQNSEQKLRNDLYNFAMQKIDARFPEGFLKKWLRATNPNMSDEEVENGFAEFLTNLKWSVIENRIFNRNDLKISYEELFDLTKAHVLSEIRMRYYGDGDPSEQELDQYAQTYLKDSERANAMFNQLKGIKVFDFLKATVKLERKEIGYAEFASMDN